MCRLANETDHDYGATTYSVLVPQEGALTPLCRYKVFVCSEDRFIASRVISGQCFKIASSGNWPETEVCD